MVSFYGVLFGMLLGSFVNVCVHRIPLGRSIVYPPSACPRCFSPIPWYGNVPLLSFLWLRGRCRFCRGTISWRYPVIELLSAALFGFVWRGPFPTTFFAVIAGTFTLFLLILSGIDADWQIIPDEFSLGLLGIAGVVSPINPFLGEGLADRVLTSVLGATVGFGLLWGLAFLGQRIFKKEALGGGDIKLMAGVGALLGAPGVMVGLFLASFLGTLFFFLMKALRRASWGHYIPFGPFLAAGVWLYFVTPSLWDRFFFP